jgi:hypothetical protein
LLHGVPQWSCPNTIVNKSEEGFLHQKLSVEDHQLSRGGDEVVAAVELEELNEDLVLVLF